MRQSRILFADDDKDIQTIVSLIIRNTGMDIISASNGEQALEKWRSHPLDLIILDIMMPVLDGLETCRRIRRLSDIPIILLTAKSQEQEIVEGFTAGADDYIVKPFRPNEFVARVKAVLWRGKHRELSKQQYLAFDNLTLELGSRKVVFQGKTIEVTPLEFQLLLYLMRHSGIVLSKEDLLRNVWGYTKSMDNSTLDLNLIEAAIRRLRKKLEVNPSRPRFIKTVWGAGYRFGN
jgi:DNA-binding response OmpR family regulator